MKNGMGWDRVGNVNPGMGGNAISFHIHTIMHAPIQ